MNWLRSFRWRILLGAFFWTLGLIPVGHLVFMAVHHRTRPRMELLPVAAGTSLVFALFCLLAGILLIRAALSPFTRLRRQLTGVREGSRPRIEGTYPIEVQPLVKDLNSLLEHRERLLRRALAKAGDLAHGLKTPLAVLAQEAERAQAADQQELAAIISLQVERMRRQVDYHLAHARAAGSGDTPGTRCHVLTAVEGLVRTLRRIYAAGALAIRVDVPSDHFVRCPRQDVEEMLGNLLDNACKWASCTVTIQSLRQNSDIVVNVDDDGPGLHPSMRDLVLERGVRADEAAPGSGLGLAIVRDLAELYQGTISLEQSPVGGLRARLRLPG
ncbi:MAG: hypothetical protein JO356_10890 [Acidobacteria bacterium]|nr:hypothetical protein [Acidobacteriota bacterium]